MNTPRNLNRSPLYVGGAPMRWIRAVTAIVDEHLRPELGWPESRRSRIVVPAVVAERRRLR